MTEILCALCGEEIKAPKGVQKGRLSREQQQGAHDTCIRTQQEIVNKYNVTPYSFNMAILEGLRLLHPEVMESQPIVDFYKREKEMIEELKQAFPKKAAAEAEKKEEEEKWN